MFSTFALLGKDRTSQPEVSGIFPRGKESAFLEGIGKWGFLGLPGYSILVLCATFCLVLILSCYYMKSVRRYVVYGDECGIDIAFKKCNLIREIGYIQEEKQEQQLSDE